MNLYKKLRLSLLLLIAGFFSLGLLAETFQLGDLAPRGAPDGLLNAADSLLLQRMVLGDVVPTNDEVKLGDVAPLGNVDGVLNTGDLVVQLRAVLGEIALGTIDISSLQPPILTVGTSPTNDNPYTITGTATPDTLVDIYVEGAVDQQIRSNISNGTFSVDVYLYDGLNDIYATESDGVDTGPISNILQVQYDNVIDRNNLPTNITVDTVWTPGSISQPYIISSDLTVDAGVNFIIHPGAELKFESGTSLVVNGNLEIIGTDLSRVSFTSSLLIKSISDWTGIEVRNGGRVNIKYAEITYASAGIYFYAGSGGNVTNSRIYNNNYGIRSYGDNSIEANNPLPIVTFNSIFNNTARNYDTNNYVNNENMVLDANSNWWGTLDTSIITREIFDYLDNTIDSPQVDISSILQSDGGTLYDHIVLTGRLQQTNVTLSSGLYTLGRTLLVDAGQTLTIEAGSRIESGRLTSNLGANGKIEVKGTLIVTGTQQNRVVFTSINPTKGVSDWSGFTILDGGSITIDYADIEYGFAIFFQPGSAGTITNSRITNNRFGIRTQGHPALPDKNPLPVITNNSIYNNIDNYDTFGYYDSANVVLNANNNWWGTTNASDIVTDITDYQDNAASLPLVDISSILDSEEGNVYSHQVLHGRLPQAITTLNGLYAIGGLLTVGVGQTLIIEAGSQIEIAKKPLVGNTSGKIEVNGTLTISGTEQNRVVLASSFAQKSNNDWDGIQVNSGGIANVNYASILHANIALRYQAGSSGTVNNSIFKDNNYAIYLDGVSSVTIDANTITNNQYGIYLAAGASPTISSNIIVENVYGIYLFGLSGDPQPNILNNDIYGNTSSNLFLSFIDTATVLNITNNWWGTDDINAIRSKIGSNGGSNQTVSVLLDTIATQAYFSSFPTGLLVNESYISPVISIGVQDTVQLVASFSQSQNWSVDIKNSTNQIVRTYLGTSVAINILWDGNDAAMQPVSDGRYSFVISIDGVNLTNIYIDSVIVDNILPTALFDAGLNASTIDTESFSIMGVALDNNFANYSVEYGEGASPTSWVMIESVKTTQVASPGSSLVEWSIVDLTPPITRLANGLYTIRLNVEDLSGNINVQQVQVQIDYVELFFFDVSHDVTTINSSQGELTTWTSQGLLDTY
ncbi:MAG: right-handed parallel beta-helix repeat-containing protein [Methylococcales bacterium]